VRGAVTLAVPLLFAEQSFLLSLQHLPRALAVALAVAVDSLLTCVVALFVDLLTGSAMLRLLVVAPSQKLVAC
jgi:hypothetical protein